MNEPVGETAKALKLFGEILTTFVGYTAAPLIIYYFLEKKWGAPQWVQIVLVMVGFVGALTHIYKRATK